MPLSSNPTKAVILASGGLDSAVTAALAKEEGCELYFLTILYGQRHHIEVERSRQIAKWLEVVEHKILQVDLCALGGSALTTHEAVPKDRRDEERAAQIPSTYVPARNTVFLSLALAYAEVIDASQIYFGANVRDYSGYPDCRPEYLRAFLEVARLGTRRGVKGEEIEVLAPLLMMTKAEIVRKGMALQVPFQLTHSCYDPDELGRACGRCDSCIIRQEAFKAVGCEDPVTYYATVDH